MSELLECMCRVHCKVVFQDGNCGECIDCYIITLRSSEVLSDSGF